jgi:hypothetical protein
VPRDGAEPRSDDDGNGDDARRRRSVIALLVVAALVGITLYVGHVLKQSARLEDCEMQGRTNCAPINPDRQ